MTGKQVRYLLGLGSNLDFEAVWDAEPMNAVLRGLPWDAISHPLTAPLRDVNSLVTHFYQHFAAGLGGEAGVDGPNVVTELVDTLPGVWTLGGTGPRAASILAKFDLPCNIHLTGAGKKILDLLPVTASPIYVESSELMFPHLVLQYPQGATIGEDLIEVISPKANRLIYVSDPENDQMPLSDQLLGEIAEADVILFSGLNAMADQSLVSERAEQVRDALRSRGEHSLFYYEDASYHHPEYRYDVYRHLGGEADIWSMNEEEASSVLGRPLVLDDAAEVCEAMNQIREVLGAKRLMVHTAKWVAMLGEDASQFLYNMELGSAVASARYAWGDEAGPQHYAALLASEATPDQQRFVAEVEEVSQGRIRCVASPDVKVDQPVTIGLGDSFVGGFLAAFSKPELQD